MSENLEYYPALAQLSSGMGTEERFIVLCARTEMSRETREEAAACMRTGINWERFMKLIDLYQVGPLVYHNVLFFDEVPEDVRTVLRQEAARVFTGNEVILRRIGSVSKAFRKNGTRALFIKGISLLVDVYRDPAFRTFADVDVLTDDMASAEKALKRAGYEACDEDREEKYRSQRLYTDGNGLYIDVHADIVGRRLHGRMIGMDMDALWPRKREITSGDTSIYTMDLEHTLLYHSLHLSMHHSFGDLRWYVDINEFINVHGESMDWDELVRLAFKYRIAKPLNYCLKFTQDLFGTCVSGSVFAELSITESSRDKWLFQRIRSNDPGVDYLAELFMFDRLSDSVKFVLMSFLMYPYLIGHFLKISERMAKALVWKKAV